MLDNVCAVCGDTVKGQRIIWGICADCEPKSEVIDGKWRLRLEPQTNYKLEFGAYVRWLEAQPKGSTVGDVVTSDQCPIHNWLASLGIDAYVYYDYILDIETLASQVLAGLFTAFQRELDHELGLDLDDKEDGLVTRETALMCAYRVLLADRQLLITSVAT